MKILDQEKMERIKALLKTHPRGLSITNLASITGMNRNLIAKYLDMLVISGQVEIQQYGPAKVFFLSQRIPVSAMIEITSDLVMVLDQDRKIIHVNKPFTRFLALKREDLVGKTIGEVNHPFLSSLPLPEASEPLDTREGGVSEVSFPDQGGESHFRIKRAPAVFEDGAVGLTLIIEDITEQRRYQENLRLSEARYRGIVQDQTEFINRFLPDTTLTFVNEALSQFMNCRPEELVGKRALDLVPDEERPVLLKSLGGLTLQNPTGISEQRIRDGRGQMRWVHWTNRAIFDETGVLREYQGIGRDITDQRETAEKISRYILQLEFISRKAVEFVHPAPDADIYPIIAAGVRSLFPDALVCVHSYDATTGAMKGQAMLDDETRFRIREILGKDPVGMLIRPGDEILEKARKGTLTRIQAEAFLACFLPPGSPDLAQLRGVIGTVDTYLMGLTYRDELLGEVVLLFKQGSAVQHEHLLVTYLNQASVAVQRQIIQEELRKSQEQYRRIIETSAEGIWVLDRDYRTTFVNPRLAEMLGFAPEEMAGRQIEEYMLPEDISAHHGRITERKAGASGHFEQRFRRKDGSLIWVMANATPIFREGEFMGAFAMVTDITGEKQAMDALRESEERIRALFDSAQDSLFIKDLSLAYVKGNAAMAAMLGMKVEEIAGKSDADLFGEATAAKIRDVDERVLRGEVVEEQVEKEILGKIHHFHTIKAPIHDSRGQITGLSGIARDITAQKWAADALQESEGKYRALVEQAHDMIVVVQDGVMKFCNQKVAAMWGGRVDEIVGQPYDKFIDPEELPRIRENYTRRMAGEQVPELYDTLLLRRDGSRVHVDLSAGTILFGGRPADLVVMRDITEKREVEDQLKRTYELQQAILNASPVGIGFVSSGRLTWANDAMYRLQGIEPGEMRGQPEGAVFADEEEYRRAKEELYRGVEKQGFGETETVWKRKDGSRVNVHIRGAPIRPGSPDFIGVVTDITDRKRAEEEIRRNSALKEAILNASPVGIGFTSHRILTWCNHAMYQIMDYEPGEMEGKPSRANYADDAEYERASRELFDGISRLGVGECETVFQRKDGSLINVHVRLAPVIPGSDETIAVVTDITSRKKAEEELRRTSALQEAILSASPAGIGLAINRVLTWCNDAMYGIVGYERGDLEGRESRILYPSDEEYDRASRQLYEGMSRQGFGECETVFQRKDGSLLNVSIRIAPVRPGSPETIAVATDITARKKAEEELRKTSELQEAILSASPVGIGVTSNRVLAWQNDAMSRIHGYSQAEMEGQPARILYGDDEEYNRVTREVSLAIETGRFRELETVWKRKDGSPVDVSLNLGPIRKGASDVIAIAQNVTARKKAEEELRRTQALQEAILRASPLGIGVRSGEVMVWGNEAMSSIHGYNREDLEGKPARMMYPDEGEYLRVTREIIRTMESGQFRELETMWKKKDGSLVQISLNVGPVSPGSSDTLAIVQDITSRKHAEEALRESEETFRTMVSINPLPLALIDEAGKYLHVNPAFTRLFGYTLEDIPDGKAWFTLAYPDEDTRKEAIRLWKSDARDHPDGEVRPRTFRVRCKGGSEKEVLFLPASTPAGLQVVVYEDITDDRILARLQESEDLYRHLVDDLNIGIYRSTGDPAGRFIWGNTGLLSIFGFEDLADLQGIPVRDLFQKPGGRKALLKELREKKFVKNRLLSLKRKDGTPVKVSVTALAEFDEGGKLQFITGLVQETGEKDGPTPGPGSS